MRRKKYRKGNKINRLIRRKKRENDFESFELRKILVELESRIFVEESRRERSSYKEHTEDALVHGAEEGRDKLRKAAGRSKYPEIRRYPNEGTHLDESQGIV